jgi:hypothetical protein
MKTIAVATALSLIVSAQASAVSKQEREKLESAIHALDKDQIHRMVLAVEGDPLSKMAEDTRPILVVYFEPIHYTVCLDQIGFLLHNEPMAFQPVFWQVVFSSGDFFLQHPEESKTRLSYMLAGLEGGLRVYERILAAKPELKHAKLDELVALRNSGRLMEYVAANPCDKK